jgi:hypothetical protein
MLLSNSMVLIAPSMLNDTVKMLGGTITAPPQPSSEEDEKTEGEETEGEETEGLSP